MIWIPKFTPTERTRPTSSRLEPRICFRAATSPAAPATASVEELADAGAFIPARCPGSVEEIEGSFASATEPPHRGTDRDPESGSGTEGHDELRVVRSFLAVVPGHVARAVLEREAVGAVPRDRAGEVEV